MRTIDLLTCNWQQSRILAGVVAAALCCCAASPTVAQVRSPEIAAKERRDPAAGEVVIINRKKKKKSATGGRFVAPNPYAPSPTTKPAPSARKLDLRKPQQRVPQKAVRKQALPKKIVRPKTLPKKSVIKKAPKPVTRTRRGVASRTPTVLPPLPDRLTRRHSDRSATARLRQFPRMEPGSRFGHSSPERPAPRYAPPYQGDAGRYERRERRSVRRFSGSRPWRQCRRWARRCEAGFDRACELWDRRCI